MVIVPGPQPKSNSRIGDLSRGKTNDAESLALLIE
jgi:hypothetical protein